MPNTTSWFATMAQESTSAYATGNRPQRASSTSPPTSAREVAAADGLNTLFLSLSLDELHQGAAHMLKDTNDLFK